MPLIHRIQRAIGLRWYALKPSDSLIAMIADQGAGRNADMLMEALKERLAHQDGSLDYVDWSAAKLNGALLSSCRIKNPRFSQAQLRGAYFGYSEISAADFTRADLRETNFREANLKDAKFDGANLRDANFARAILAGGSFNGADLAKANFWRADLRGADLKNASMLDCSMVDVRVNQATRLPDGEKVGGAVCWERYTAPRETSGD